MSNITNLLFLEKSVHLKKTFKKCKQRWLNFIILIL